MKESINMEIISKIAHCIELKDIYLLKSECNLFDECFLNNNNEKINIHQSFQGNIKDLVPGKKFKVLVEFKLKTEDLQDASEKDKKIIFLINATFILVYSFNQKEDFKKDDLGMFANVNGVFNCWPYWREFVQNITPRMGLPSLIVPLLKIPKKPPPVKKPQKAKIK